ncbi:hypothetical protein XF_1088 [Xylella fastidiosa 9a5c]|uniref:Uncharacterized protein n=1 Tax=Xylella fastidiosa (strain 9a5c) TaxID=160492 RepID=Q9PEE0_XYLFA|nr:hypothetical protein XF_1088 [Xylella fastidiosa 9a5c]
MVWIGELYFSSKQIKLTCTDITKGMQNTYLKYKNHINKNKNKNSRDRFYLFFRSHPQFFSVLNELFNKM